MSKPFFATRARRQQGATAVEYGLIAGLIAIAIVVGLGIIGPRIGGVFTSVGNALPEAAATK